MAYLYTSADGLAQSNDPAHISLWDRLIAADAEAEAQATEQLRAAGVKAAHPDDGWVNRVENYVSFAYPQFNDGVQVGDLIALGWCWQGYRVVRCTEVRRWGIVTDTLRYHFEVIKR